MENQQKLEKLLEILENAGVIVNRGTSHDGNSWVCIRMNNGKGYDEIIFFDEDFTNIMA